MDAVVQEMFRPKRVYSRVDGEEERALEVGLAFVAMKSNVAELTRLYHLASSIGASQVLVSHLLPHTQEMVGEILYECALGMGPFAHGPFEEGVCTPRIDLPPFDITDATGKVLLALLRNASSMTLAGANLAQQTDYCPFVQAGALAVRRDGQVSPCPPLLHSHPLFVNGHWKQIRHYSAGSIAELPLIDIWNSNEYASFRRRVRAFDFSPCTFCGGCDRVETNEEDCYGNTFPVCGECLWARGLVRCP